MENDVKLLQVVREEKREKGWNFFALMFVDCVRSKIYSHTS